MSNMTEENITDEPKMVSQEEYNNLKSQYDALTASKSEILNDYKQFKTTIDELGGLDSIKSSIEQTKQQKEEQLQQENSLDALKSHYDEEITKANNKNEELKLSIVNSAIDTQLRSAVTKAKGSYTLLEHQLKSQVKGQYENGKVTITVNDENGMPLMVEGKEAGLTDLVNAYKAKDDFARAFDVSQGITGSGTPTGGKVTSTKQPETLAEITELYKTNPTKAMELMKAKGLA